MSTKRQPTRPPGGARDPARGLIQVIEFKEFGWSVRVLADGGWVTLRWGVSLDEATWYSDRLREFANKIAKKSRPSAAHGAKGEGREGC